MNHHLGILAGMWPCGIIAFIRELFNAESISQVYGNVHQFLHTTSTQLSVTYWTALIVTDTVRTPTIT